MPIVNGNLPDANEVNNAYSQIFRNSAQIFMNGSLAGFNSKLNNSQGPNFQNLTFNANVSGISIGSGIEAISGASFKWIPISGIDSFNGATFQPNMWASGGNAGAGASWSITLANSQAVLATSDDGGAQGQYMMYGTGASWRDLNDKVYLFIGGNLSSSHGGAEPANDNVYLMDAVSGNQVIIGQYNPSNGSIAALAGQHIFKFLIDSGAKTVTWWNDFTDKYNVGTSGVVSTAALGTGSKWGLKFWTQTANANTSTVSYALDFLSVAPFNGSYISNAYTNLVNVDPGSIISANTTINSINGSGGVIQLNMTTNSGTSFTSGAFDKVVQLPAGSQFRNRLTMIGSNGRYPEVYQTASWYGVY